MLKAMSADSTSACQIVRWEILPGLPGDTVPYHFHRGHPTPWAEGLVVSFRNLDSSEWIGNFQGCQDWSRKEEHRMVFVAANTVVFAYGRDRRLRWTRSGLGGYDAQLKGCANGVLTVEVEEELGGSRKEILLSAADGRIL
jgi:hypothetical protein